MATTPRLYSAAELLGLPLGQDLYNSLFPALDSRWYPSYNPEHPSNWQDLTDSSMGESNQILTSGRPSKEALDSLNGYQFAWTPQGYGSSGVLTAIKDGKPVQSFGQHESTMWEGLTDWATLAAAGFGGLGLIGAGPLAAGAAAGGAGAGSSLTGPGAYDAYAAMDAGYGAAGADGAAGAAGAAGGAAGAPMSFDALRAAEMANMGQTVGNIPATVNMGSLGGTTATTGGFGGAMSVAGQELADAVASSQLGGTAASSMGQSAGGMLGSIGSSASDVAAWMKANPTLGRLLFSGATSLMSASGGGSGGAASSGVGSLAGSNGPAKQWTSPIQQGLLSPVKQYTPAPITQLQPQGLLAQGQVADGAWRFFGNRG